MVTYAAHGGGKREEIQTERETVTNDRSFVGGGVIHIQFPPPSVTLSVFVAGEMDHLRTHTHTHTHTLYIFLSLSDSLSVTTLEAFVLAA